MKYNLVIILIIIPFNLFYTNGEPEPDPKPQYIPNYLKDSLDWASSHVPHVNADFSLGFGHGNKQDVDTSGVKTSGVKTSGVKTKTNSQSQSGVKTGGGGAYRGGCTSPPTVHNAQTKCSLYSGCRSSCVGDYKFPNGQTTLFITCTEGRWEVDGTEWETIPSCEPICSPACLNNGICIAPNICNCPDNYSGAQCQTETKKCLTFPPIPMNSARKCSHTSCTVTCMKGHQFSDGSTIANMACNNGYWVPAKSEWSQIPDCKATCTPPCQNGGNCLSLNVCQCSQAFRGPQCQYSINACNARKLKLNFNGGYKCSGNGESFWCTLSCPAGIKFTFTPAQKYNCDYAVGVFLPQPMPQCVYGSGMEVIPIEGDSRDTYHYENGSDSTSSGTHGENHSGFGTDVEIHVNHTHHPGSKDEFVDEQNRTVIPGTGTHGTIEGGDIMLGQKNKSGNCFTWGGSHYKTFDGKVFSFNSLCSYTLIRDEVFNSFSIVIKNSKVCAHHPDNCHKTIKIYYQDKVYTLKHSGQGVPVFALGKKILPVPGRVPGIRVEMSAHYFIVMLDSVGAKLKWDGKQFLQVEASQSLWNKTTGLCGKLDGNRDNDMVTKDGVIPKSVVTLASSWQVDPVGETCEDSPTEEHVCQDTFVKGNAGQQALAFCTKLLNDKRFSPCASFLDISLLMDACRWDYCSSTSSNPREFACETLNVFVRECSMDGVKKLTNWRDEDTCPMTCSGGRVYMPCGPVGGQQICGAASERNDDNVVCEEGCYCPEGTILHDSKCITKDECPCLYRGKYYPPHSSIPSDCNTCDCIEGKWICTGVTCGARCSALGDPHYITFDGKRFDFMGQCNYVLLKHDNFTIEAENVACAGSISQAMNFPISVSSGLPSCTKTVTIKISGQTIKLKQNHEIVVNGQEVTKIPLNIAGVQIRAISSIFLIAQLPNGAEVWWDGLTRAYIDVPASFMGHTKGLCGTFNGNQNDDFLTPFGDVEHSTIAFANKWKTTERCNDISDKPSSDPCQINVQNKEAAEEHCDVINSILFSDCHSEVDPAPFYKDCLYDMCSCETKIPKCLCPIIAAYATECASKGIKVDWRNDVRECGVHCSGGQSYQVCGNSCTRTCTDMANNLDCVPKCVEGCNCQDGEAIDEHGECIPIGQCGCQYEGLTFNPGYKEVRPASKAPELCTCLNAQWSCRPATPNEITNFPKISDIKTACKASENKEFTTCEPVEPVTCKNMHSNDYLVSASICHAGCQCKDGYVLDSFHKVCVKPTECPCHHGGRSYADKSVVQNDCNNCTCMHGKWSCTDAPCPSECSAWGDSHYKTFDGKMYDYQGECDYILAKGSYDYLAFDISIQNVPCSTLGVSCSKSITIKVGIPPNEESITLTSGKEIPAHATFQHLTLRQIGKYVFVEAPETGFVVKWDKGTRVYVKLTTEWKNKVKGLCGNYNDNQLDDFQTPSGGVKEVSVKLFGDSWRLQTYCPEAVEITDTCAQRPDRKVWALEKCGILKSPVFSVCHSEIPIETYLEKCIFDTCACDQGGDCECLCTALAAYAQECSNKGIHIKWRTPDLCPMQCDEHCSNYSPCISTCLIETCDNMLVQSSLSQSCGKESCVEGCQVKKCKPGFIYLNSSFVECVPRNICKPLCLEIDGKQYYEGDLVEEDACHTCYCSRGKKSCKGQPCVTTTSKPATEQETEKVKCVDGWTEWINQDKLPPSKANIKGKLIDLERLPGPLVMNALRGSHCEERNIVDIECRTTSTHISAKATGLDAVCSLEYGLICKADKNGKLCPDFEIRVKCKCDVTTPPPVVPCENVDTFLPHPYNCQLFYQCAPGEHGNKYVIQSCGPGTWYHPINSVCDFPYNVAKIRPECDDISIDVSRPPGHVTTTTTESGGGIVEPPGSQCPDDEEYEPCLIKCQQLCQHFSYVVKREGHCKNQQLCMEGCNNAERSLSCPSGMFWANQHTCVAQHDCMCISNKGKPVKPGVIIYESYCKVCQCIDNYYTCDESSCVHGIHTTTEKPDTHVGNETSTPESIIITNTYTPPAACSENNYINLIDGEIPLNDDAFSASSTMSKDFAPKYGRLHKNEAPDSEKSWVPKLSTNNQYLQINLGKQEPVYGIILRGNPSAGKYITSFKVLYTPDGHSFSYIPDFRKKPQIFRGSVDSATPVKRMFDIPIEAQIIKIKPDTWVKGIALNLELIGCNKYTTTIEPIVTTPSTYCIDPMGVGEGVMADQQISVSSELLPHHSKNQLKINGKFAWQPITNSPSEWVQFDFLGPRNITGFITKGGPDGWVTAFNVKYSANGRDWNPIMGDDWKEHLFLGNYDENTPEVISLDVPIQTRYIKIIPVNWHQNIQLRIEPHGCFEPYAKLQFTTQFPPTACSSCPGAPSAEMELGACKCDVGLWWDGKNCVTRTNCPCIIGDMSYPIGGVFEKDDCSQCVCKLGGISHCNPKVCEKCREGLRSVLTSTCGCNCKPCDAGTKICPTSNICINTTAWCNGVKDCPDDETGCEVTRPPVIYTLPPPITVTEPPEHVTCPVFSCPPGYKVVTVKSSKTSLKTMFSKHDKQSYKKPGFKTGVKGGTKGGTSGGVKTSGSGGRRGGSVQKVTVQSERVTKEPECPVYQCVPLIPPPTGEECEVESCPIGYIPQYVTLHTKEDSCPTYVCKPIQPPDSICNVTGNTFNTFDSTEYKYDICNHVLARDAINSKWEVLLRKNCSKICKRDLIIHHEDHTIVIHPDFFIEYNGYKYTVQQTKLIGNRFNLFDIDILGEKLIFNSNKFGFWVEWDNQQNVKVGVSRQLLGEVDGLCGYFNGRSRDDKRKPDGTPAKTTVEFGNSWALPDSTVVCETKTCPVQVQHQAWTMCNLVKDRTFAPCGKAVDIDTFISRCLESACTCLEAAGSDKSAHDNCRCKTLQNFAVHCLVTDSSLELMDWRRIHDCPAVCEAPFVHNDCYKRRCEPGCGSLSDPDACPKLDNVCFPGCYCPPGYVRKGESCILPTSCGDCECNVLPRLKYETYDHNNFTVNGDCVYVMSRDVVDNKNQDHKFQVLITNAPCEDRKSQTCVGKITILYNGHKIHVMKDLPKKKLRLIVDSEHVSDFSEIESWLTVKEEMKHFKIFLDALQIKVSVYYPSLGVAVKAPSLKYGGKLEGLCGDCDGTTDDDLTKSDGVITENIDDFATSWLYENLPGGQDKAKCKNKPKEVCNEVPVERDPCIQLEDVIKYGQCRPLLDPTLFVEWCKEDTCNGNPQLSCQSIEAYSTECSQLGFCIDWRTNLCPSKPCPVDQIYKPCGPKCPETCASLKEKVQKCNNPPLEGCFCPEGKVMLNGTCVVKDRCEACDDEGHHSGDSWKKDLCTNCTCEGNNIKCEKQNCPSVETICQQGFNALKVQSAQECCNKYMCVPMPNATCEPPQQMHCGAGQVLKLITGHDGCQQFVCSCKPIEDCESINGTVSATPAPGIVKTIDNSGCCPVVIESCDAKLCPKRDPCPQFYNQGMRQLPEQCCPEYFCMPPFRKCVVELMYTASEKGGERPRNNFEKKQVLKQANDTWKDGPCRDCICNKSPVGDYYSSCSVAECPAVTESVDHNDYQLVSEPVLGQCCPNIRKAACKHNGKLYKVGEKRPVEGDYCTTIECADNMLGIQKLTNVEKCERNCDLGWEYSPPTPESKQCCGSCKPVACVVDGVIHKVGDEWASLDHCVNFFCLSLNGSIQIQSVVVTCTELSEDLLNDFIVETIPVEGECCPNHKVTACKVGSKRYNVGSIWPSPDGNKCKKIKCAENALGEISKQDSIETCNKNCSRGWEYRESNTKCCGACAQVACVDDNNLRKPGENWTSFDGCTTYTCLQVRNQFTVASHQESCPNVDDCPIENIYRVGCCKHCNTTSVSQVNCDAKTLAPLQTIGAVAILRPPHGKCSNKESIIGFTECEGACSSSTLYNARNGLHESKCECCQPKEFTSINVLLECEDGHRFKKTVSVPTVCDCNKACAVSKGGTKTGVKTG